MTDVTQEFIVQLVQVLLSGLVLLLARGLIVLANSALDAYKEQIGVQRYEQIRGIVRGAVLAVEQVGIAGELQRTGDEKKREAIALIKTELERIGLGFIPVDSLSTMIEETVFDELRKFDYELVSYGDSDSLPDAED